MDVALEAARGTEGGGWGADGIDMIPECMEGDQIAISDWAETMGGHKLVEKARAERAAAEAKATEAKVSA